MIDIKILSTPNCAPCEQAVRIVEKLKGEFPDFHWEKIDLVEHPELALEYRVLASPGIVINGKLEFVGGVKESQLRERLQQIVSARGEATT
ncbi:MAG: thioredoxin family protein [Dehalococcoidia bacterium]